MTALATFRYHTLRPTTSSDENDLRKEKTLSAFQSFKSTRKPNLDLVSDAFTFAQESKIQFKVIDLISIYRTALEMREDLSPHKIAVCDRFLDEIESCLRYFLDHKILPVRKMTVSQIVGPVAERQTHRDRK